MPLTAYAGTTPVTLVWDAVSATDLGGYNVWFVDKYGALPSVKLASVGKVTTASVECPEVVGSGAFQLKVTAFDVATQPNESAMSAPAVKADGSIFELFDLTPPAAPKNVKVTN